MTYEIQRGLSQLQAESPLKALLVSPVKAAFSCVETIMGIAGTILFGVGALVFVSPSLACYSVISLTHVCTGLISLVYSVSNFLTFGAVGRMIEGNLFGRQFSTM